MTKGVFIKSLIVFLIVSISSCIPNKGLDIVTDGSSNYEIVVKNNASKEVQFAAKELQDYIRKISNTNLPIVNQEKVSEGKYAIFVQVKELDEIQIQFKTEGNNLVISGGSSQAVKNAVYEFLEQYLGCKWYATNV